MSATILDAQSAAHSASMDTQGWAREFVQAWIRPLMEMEMARTVEQTIAMFEQMPPEMHDAMQKANPTQHAEIMRAMSELKKRGKNGNSPV